MVVPVEPYNLHHFCIFLGVKLTYHSIRAPAIVKEHAPAQLDWFSFPSWN